MKNVRHNWIPKQNVRYNLIPNEKHAVQLDSQEKRTTRPRTGPPKKHTTRQPPGPPVGRKSPKQQTIRRPFAVVACLAVDRLNGGTLRGQKPLPQFSSFFGLALAREDLARKYTNP